MRYIGNKTRLLPAIEEFLAEHGATGRTFCDIFAGTCVVGRHFKRLGYRIVANDLMATSYAIGVATIECSRYPDFGGILGSRARGSSRSRRPAPLPRRSRPGSARPLEDAIAFLNERVAPREGLIFRSFAPGGGRGRRYFRDSSARKIDGVLEFLRAGRRSGRLGREEFYLLLSALIDAADRVANISGTYGAYLKRWQPSALKPLELRVPEVIPAGSGHRMHREDSNRLIGRIRPDILYIDPPYNTRQYASNYHPLEVIAEYHRIRRPRSYESTLRGKTGLPPADGKHSLYCVRPSRRNPVAHAEWAVSDLLARSRARHVVFSYNEEGILGEEALGRILARYEGRSRFDFRRRLRRVGYRRFRSDSDRQSRSYRIIEGKERDQVDEWLLYARRRGW